MLSSKEKSYPFKGTLSRKQSVTSLELSQAETIKDHKERDNIYLHLNTNYTVIGR